MSSSSKRKSEKLGMPHGTARNKLVKALLWDFVCKSRQNICYQCGSEILSISDLSIEHVEPWENSEDPVRLFFDTSNIAYSHLSCNIGARHREKAECGTVSKYRAGCRCEDCKNVKTKSHQIYREKVPYSSEKRRERYLRLNK